MKKVWAVMLDLLSEINRVCKKYDIKYFASCGTMLGAVRHKGFIPWDDDLDIMMFRSDYEKLCEVAEKEFQHPYFFQTEWNDRGSLRGHAQLRNSLTTGILTTEYCRRYSFNQGIFIDIFPLDAVTDDDVKFKKLQRQADSLKSKFYFFANFTDRYYIPDKKHVKDYIRLLLHKICPDVRNSSFDYDNFYRKYEELCCSCNNENTKKLAVLGWKFRKIELVDRTDLSEVIDMPFEFLTIKVPKNYDHALKQIYGDYMKFVKGSSAHGGMILDAEIPYTEYLKEGSQLVFDSDLYYHD